MKKSLVQFALRVLEIARLEGEEEVISQALSHTLAECDEQGLNIFAPIVGSDVEVAREEFVKMLRNQIQRMPVPDAVTWERRTAFVDNLDL